MDDLRKSTQCQSNGLFGLGGSLTDTDDVAEGPRTFMEEYGEVWMGRRDLRRGRKCRFVAPLSCALLIMRAYVAVLANPDATHGNADGVTNGRARRNKPCAYIP